MGLLEDARNIQRKDPAARNVLEVILLYPGFHILVYHRIAHWLITQHHKYLFRSFRNICRNFFYRFFFWF